MLYLSHRVWYSFQPAHSEKTDVLLNSSIKQVGLYFIPPLYQGPPIIFFYSPLIFIFFENLLCSRNFDDLFENSPGVFCFCPFKIEMAYSFEIMLEHSDRLIGTGAISCGNPLELRYYLLHPVTLAIL